MLYSNTHTTPRSEHNWLVSAATDVWSIPPFRILRPHMSIPVVMTIRIWRWPDGVKRFTPAVRHIHVKTNLPVGNKFEKCVTLKTQMFLDKTLSCWASSSCFIWLHCLHIHCQAVFFLDWLTVKTLQLLQSLAVTQRTMSHIQKHLSPIPLWEPQI